MSCATVIANGKAVLLLGPPGHLAVALGREAIVAGFGFSIFGEHAEAPRWHKSVRRHRPTKVRPRRGPSLRSHVDQKYPTKNQLDALRR